MYYASSTKESHLSFNGKITHTAIEKHNEKTMGNVEYIVVLTKFDIYVLIAAHLILSNIGFTTYYCRKLS
jgi:hypothetical protein